MPAAACARRTAPGASSSPAPHVEVVQVEPAGNGLALAASISRTAAALESGATDSINATTPLTSGAAKLVPARYVTPSVVGLVGPRFTSVSMLLALLAPPLPPGAAMSMRGP